MPMPTARQRSSAWPVASCSIGETGIDARAGKEIAADVQAGTLRGDHDHVHVLRRDDAGLFLVGDGKAVREIQRVAGLEIFLHDRPDGALGGVRNEHLDDGALLHRFLDVEQRLAGFPAVGDGAVPVALERFGLADDDLEAVVAQVQSLRRALHAVADDGDGLVFEHLAGARHREFLPRDDFFLCSAKINRCHNSIFLVCVLVQCLQLVQMNF